MAKKRKDKPKTAQELMARALSRGMRRTDGKPDEPGLVRRTVQTGHQELTGCPFCDAGPRDIIDVADNLPRACPMHRDALGVPDPAAQGAQSEDLISTIVRLARSH